MDEWKPAGEIDGLFQKRAAPEPKIVATPATPAAPVPAIPSPPTAAAPWPDRGVFAAIRVAEAQRSAGRSSGCPNDFLCGLSFRTPPYRIPWVVLIFVFCGSGYLFGKPLGVWLRKSGFKHRSGARLVCLLLVVAAAVIGEFIYIGGLLSLAEQPAGLADIAAHLIEPFSAKDFMGSSPPAPKCCCGSCSPSEPWGCHVRRVSFERLKRNGAASPAAMP